MSKILISGGTGLIGSHLTKKLKEKGYDVAILSRDRKKLPLQTYFWNPGSNEIEREAIVTSDYIIHLAGENIFNKKWTEKRKKEIIDSRVKTTELLYNKVTHERKNLKAFISASAIGYYGAVTSEKIFSENDPPGKDFLGQVCYEWEKAADKFIQSGIRVVKIRTSPVLAKNGGALAKMKTQAKFWLGSALGNGNQYQPWIHIDDLCNIYIKAIEDEKMNGAYNAAAPDQKTNKEFMKTLTRVMHKPFWFPNVPKWLLKLIFGEKSAMILEGSRVSVDKIENAGYKFIFPELESALKDLV